MIWHCINNLARINEKKLWIYKSNQNSTGNNSYMALLNTDFKLMRNSYQLYLWYGWVYGLILVYSCFDHFNCIFLQSYNVCMLRLPWEKSISFTSIIDWGNWTDMEQLQCLSILGQVLMSWCIKNLRKVDDFHDIEFCYRFDFKYVCFQYIIRYVINILVQFLFK